MMIKLRTTMRSHPQSINGAVKFRKWAQTNPSPSLPSHNSTRIGLLMLYTVPSTNYFMPPSRPIKQSAIQYLTAKDRHTDRQEGQTKRTKLFRSATKKQRRNLQRCANTTEETLPGPILLVGDVLLPRMRHYGSVGPIHPARHSANIICLRRTVDGDQFCAQLAVAVVVVVHQKTRTQRITQEEIMPEIDLQLDDDRG